MEDAAEAIKIAGFTLLFVTALTIAMITVMQGKRTSETIISYSDKTRYYSEVEKEIDPTSGNGILTNNEGNRIVNIYDIIPTLYRYKQEEYIVLFEDPNRQPLQIYDGETNINKQTNDYTKKISYLNYNLEDKLQENWTRNNNTVKGHVDDVVNYLLNNYNEFIETIETTYDIYHNNAGMSYEDTSNTEDEEDKREIRVIKYTLKTN